MKLDNVLTDLERPADLARDGAGPKMRFGDMILIMVYAAAGESGRTAAEMDIDLAVISKCKADPEALEFNSEETQLIRKYLGSHKWPIVHENIREFRLAVEAADS